MFYEYQLTSEGIRRSVQHNISSGDIYVLPLWRLEKHFELRWNIMLMHIVHTVMGKTYIIIKYIKISSHQNTW